MYRGCWEHVIEGFKGWLRERRDSLVLIICWIFMNMVYMLYVSFWVSKSER